MVINCGGTRSPAGFLLYLSLMEGSSELRLALHLWDWWAVIFIVFWCWSFLSQPLMRSGNSALESSWHQKQNLLQSQWGSAWRSLWHDQTVKSLVKSCSTLNCTHLLYFHIDSAGILFINSTLLLSWSCLMTRLFRTIKLKQGNSCVYILWTVSHSFIYTICMSAPFTWKNTGFYSIIETFYAVMTLAI